MVYDTYNYIGVYYIYWLVVWNILYFSIYWDESSQLTKVFQRGWNHQPEYMVNIYGYYMVNDGL